MSKSNWTPVRPEITKIIEEIVHSRLGWKIEKKERTTEYNEKLISVSIYDCNGAKLLWYSETTSRIYFNRFNNWCEMNCGYPFYLNTITQDTDCDTKAFFEAFLFPPVEKCKGSASLFGKMWECGKTACKKFHSDGQRMKPFCTHRDGWLCGMERCARYEICTEIDIVRRTHKGRINSEQTTRELRGE